MLRVPAATARRHLERGVVLAVASPAPSGTAIAGKPCMEAIRAELAAERRVLDDLMLRLEHDLATGSHKSLQTTWCELEHRLLSRMDVEEQFLLPLLEPAHRADVTRVRSEHRRIRALAEHVGVTIELHTVQPSDVRELARALNEQARREDSRLYHFAWERTSPTVQHRIAALLRAAGRGAHEAALRTSAGRSESEATTT